MVWLAVLRYAVLWPHVLGHALVGDIVLRCVRLLCRVVLGCAAVVCVVVPTKAKRSFRGTAQRPTPHHSATVR